MLTIYIMWRRGVVAQRKHAQFSSGGLLVRILTLPFFQGVEISGDNRVAENGSEINAEIVCFVL